VPANVDLEPDRIVTELEGVTDADTPELVALIGFLGDDPGDDPDAPEHVRLYADPHLFRWLQLPRASIKKRERLSEETAEVGPATKVWVDAAVLREEYPGRPEKLQVEFLQDRAELGIEPPMNAFEAADYMTLMADYYFGWGTTRPSRPPRKHC
jgi:hypothetical protein